MYVCKFICKKSIRERVICSCVFREILKIIEIIFPLIILDLVTKLNNNTIIILLYSPCLCLIY